MVNRGGPLSLGGVFELGEAVQIKVGRKFYIVVECTEHMITCRDSIRFIYRGSRKNPLWPRWNEMVARMVARAYGGK